MTTDLQKETELNSMTRFTELFADFCVGLVDAAQIHTAISELVEREPGAAEAVVATLDAALRDGLIKADTYDSLTADVNRATSEDEATEWSEETCEQYERGDAGISATDDTRYPVADQTAMPRVPTPSAAQIMPGTVLKNRFELVTRIGAGSMADVFEAIDRRKLEAGSADPRVAIKVVSRAFSTHPNALKTLQREALNSQGLIHPNIIRVFDFDWDNDRFFMTMELLEGQPLVALLDKRRTKPVPFALAEPIVECMCEGLRYAHTHGVIHADIKPGNIFVSATGPAKILDFGIARIIQDAIEPSESPVTGAHTPAYASCEVLEGDEPTAQDDIFAMACVTYRMLAGRRAFGSLTALSAERKHFKPQRLDTLTPQQWAILKQSLAFRRADRTTDVETFATEFLSPEQHLQPTGQSRFEPNYAADEPPARRLALRYGLPAMALASALIAITLTLFWPEPEPSRPPVARTESSTPQILREPTEAPGSPASNPVQPVVRTAHSPVIAPLEFVGPVEPQEPQAVVSTETTLDPANPAPDLSSVATVNAAQTRINELATLADNALNEGRLLDPVNDNARLYIAEMAALSPQAPEIQPRRIHLADLMLLEAMVAISDENFDAANRWIAQTDALGVPQGMTQRFEVELQKARDAKSARQAETLNAIFASATPVAILADPNVDFGVENDEIPPPNNQATGVQRDPDTGPTTGPGSLSLVMMLPGAMPNIATDTTEEAPTGESSDTASNYVALSALEFDRMVQPRYPRRLLARGISGWVDVKFRVTTDGRTADIAVIAAEPAKRFDQAAILAVTKWRFKPVYVNGVATEKTSSIKLRFEPR